MDYMKYNKWLVLLEEEDKSFAMRQDVMSKAHLKIETGSNKGAMRLEVSNLNYSGKGKYIYKLILLGTKNEKTIHTIIGTVAVNKHGSGESYFRIQPKDIDGKGNSLSDYSMAIVAAISTQSNKEPLHPVLKGDLNIPKEEVVKKAEETVNKEEEIKKVEEASDSKKALNNNNVEEGAGEDHHQYEPRKYNKFYNQYILRACVRTQKMSIDSEEIVPFKDDRLEAVWKRINEPSGLPLVSQEATKAASKYKHYLFGEAESKYYFAVPGRFLREEQPDQGNSGFVYWQPILGAEQLEATKEGCSKEKILAAYGYWIVAVDRETGDIEEA